ncbi:hypothetical protein CYY_005384 [Polysphondylium violaceum]|uniref:BED-type domain-containing protein n=1 Tax=Polysphondylium violaceum TaxID=133409 RepID=A0A8J4V485_9MYCE|nr:hypothetical protein CYY_005384 [Polysphondylium violaceum]
MKARRTKKILNPVWQFFKRGDNKAVCNTCSYSYNISGANNSSGNAKKHLQRAKCSGGVQYCKEVLGITMPNNPSITISTKECY